MGVECCAESARDQSPSPPLAVDEKMKDLPAINWEGIRDPYARFEASLPFNRTLINVMN